MDRSPWRQQLTCSSATTLLVAPCAEISSPTRIAEIIDNFETFSPELRKSQKVYENSIWDTVSSEHFLFLIFCPGSHIFPLLMFLPWLSRWLTGKEFAFWFRRPGFNSWVRKIPWRRKWQPTPIFLPWKSNGQRSVVGYSPWGRKELDTTEHTHTQTQPIFHPPFAKRLLFSMRFS